MIPVCLILEFLFGVVLGWLACGWWRIRPRRTEPTPGEVCQVTREFTQRSIHSAFLEGDLLRWPRESRGGEA